MGTSKIVYEGWMVRVGRRKIGRSFIHMRYFVLEPRLLAYYKRKPQDNQVPIKTLVVDGNCRVEDRGLKTHHGHKVYDLCIYNKKSKYHRITMAAFNIQEALIWKQRIEQVIDQHQESQVSGNKYVSFEYKYGAESARNASSSDHESQLSAQEDGEDVHLDLSRRTTIGNGPPETVLDWTRVDTDLSHHSTDNQAFSRKHWRLLQCQNGLRIFEELSDVDYLPRSCSRAMKAVGVVEATCEEIFELVMSINGTRFEWDCSFQYGSVVEEVDGHTAVIYHRLILDWFPMFVWPRDLVYVRYWRRNDDGSYVVLFRSKEHENCGPQPGFVRAHLESGGFNISPLKSQDGRPRTQVQHLMQIDLKGWGVGYISYFQQHCLLQMLNSVAGLREYFSQIDERTVTPRISVMVNMASTNLSPSKGQKLPVSSVPSGSVDHMTVPDRASAILYEFSDDDEEFQMPEVEDEACSVTLENELKKAAAEEEPKDQIDFSSYKGNLRHDDHENARNCWRVSNGNNFKVRSMSYCYDKSKMLAGKHLMDLVAVDWFKDSKRIDHVARRHGCAVQVASEKGFFSLVVNVQVPGSTHYSMVFYFVSKELVPGSLLQRFVDGDDEFRNSRLKLIPSVPKGSWIVRQSVGSTPCLLGKAVDCTYIRGPNYLEIDADIGSSTVANGVLGLVVGVITTLVVDMAFLVQANTYDELPERLIGAVRVSHIELSSAIVPKLESNTLND